jgi:hypothetical protein
MLSHNTTANTPPERIRATRTVCVSFLEGVCSLICWNEIEERSNEKNARFQHSANSDSKEHF